MSLYSYADLTLSSDLPLTPLLTIRNGDGESSPDFIFRFLNLQPIEPADSDWLHHWRTEAGDLTFSLAKHNDGYLFRFPALVDFVISADTRQIGAWPIQESDNETLQHLLLDQVLPRLLGHRGLLVLHASAVCVGDSAIAFAGETGRGKSTLAASLHMAGFTILSDDGLVVTADDTRSTALPIYSGLRLWPQSMAAVVADTIPHKSVAHYSNKRRVVMNEQVVTTPLPLAAIYVLTSPPLEDNIKDISIDHLSSRDASVELMRNSFRFHVNSHQLASDLLATTSAVASQVSVFTLHYPRNYSSLPDVRASIIEHHEHRTGSVQKG